MGATEEPEGKPQPLSRAQLSPVVQCRAVPKALLSPPTPARTREGLGRRHRGAGQAAGAQILLPTGSLGVPYLWARYVR